ncbi:hypothetical protein ACVIJ6_006249 [Bradyrhizobium sp. USDA 4369]
MDYCTGAKGVARSFFMASMIASAADAIQNPWLNPGLLSLRSL